MFCSFLCIIVTSGHKFKDDSVITKFFFHFMFSGSINFNKFNIYLNKTLFWKISWANERNFQQYKKKTQQQQKILNFHRDKRTLAAYDNK